MRWNPCAKGHDFGDAPSLRAVISSHINSLPSSSTLLLILIYHVTIVLTAFHAFFILRTNSYFWQHTISNGEPVLVPHLYQGAIFQPRSCIPRTSSQFCCDTISIPRPSCYFTVTSLPTGASSAATPPLKWLGSAATSLPTSSQFCHNTFASSFQRPRLPRSAFG